jgi:hypothetical protein
MIPAIALITCKTFLTKKNLLGIAVIVVRKERVKEKERRNRK